MTPTIIVAVTLLLGAGLIVTALTRRKRNRSLVREKFLVAEKIFGSVGMQVSFADAAMLRDYVKTNDPDGKLLVIKDGAGVLCGKQPMIKDQQVEDWERSLIRWLANYKYSIGYKDAKKAKRG